MVSKLERSKPVSLLSDLSSQTKHTELAAVS